MKYENLTIEFPPLSDEAAASLQKFINALMYAIDEQYYRQIHRHYSNELNKMLIDVEDAQEKLGNPPF